MTDFKFEDEAADEADQTPPAPQPPPAAPQAPPPAPRATATGHPAAPRTPPAAPRPPVAPKATPSPPVRPATPQATPSTPAKPAAPAKPAPAAKPHPAAPAAPAMPGAKPLFDAPSVPVSHREEIPAVGFQAQLRRVLDAIDPYVEWVFRVATLAAVLTLGFVLLCVFNGSLAKLGANTNSAELMRNLSLAARILSFALMAMAVSALIMLAEDRTIAAGILISGLVLVFGAPWLIMSRAVGTSTSPYTVEAARSIIVPLRHAGSVLAVLGLCKGVLDLVLWFQALPARVKQRADVGVAAKAEPAQQKVAAQANLFSPCWKLPFCRETIRKQCPAFLAKKRCWKFGRGCYCDEEMIARIVRGESLNVIKAPTRMSRQGKPPCGRCYIYLEHQSLKFKALSPLALPLTLVLIYFGWPYYEHAFGLFSKSMDAVWGLISFDPKSITPEAIATKERVQSELSPEQISTFAMYLFGVIGGFFLLIYISKFFEWAIFKAKW